MIPEQRDRQLVRAAQAGDVRAEDRLVRLYRPFALHFASDFYYPGGDDDDVRQEALLGLLKAIRSYDPLNGASFKTFAAMCIHRQTVTGLKTAQRGKHQSLSFAARVGVSDEGEELQIVDLLPSPYSRDPHIVVVEKERLERLLVAIHRLSTLERISVLGIANGVPYSVIAQETGRNGKAIDNAAQRARAKLRDAA